MDTKYTSQQNDSKKSRKSNSKKKNTIVTCQGCLENQPNQLAHTEYGGCLYQSD